MGYRSDICFAVTKEALAIKLLKEEKEPAMFSEDWVEIEEIGNIWYYSIDNIKWYEGYNEVDEVMAWLSTIEPIIKTRGNGVTVHHEWEEEQYGFLRIGEDDEDIEFRGDPGHYDIWMERHISKPPH